LLVDNREIPVPTHHSEANQFGFFGKIELSSNKSSSIPTVKQEVSERKNRFALKSTV
jgi:hypothetical protein